VTKQDQDHGNAPIQDSEELDSPADKIAAPAPGMCPYCGAKLIYQDRSNDFFCPAGCLI
jgi:hypothetical protein